MLLGAISPLPLYYWAQFASVTLLDIICTNILLAWFILVMLLGAISPRPVYYWAYFAW